MIAIDELAKDLHMKPEELMKEGIRSFLNERLLTLESELFLLAKKYGTKDVFVFDEKIREGKFHEEEAFEDYFKFDNLEAERDRIKKYLEQM